MTCERELGTNHTVFCEHRRVSGNTLSGTIPDALPPAMAVMCVDKRPDHPPPGRTVLRRSEPIISNDIPKLVSVSPVQVLAQQSAERRDPVFFG